jgi:hypothetical protein
MDNRIDDLMLGSYHIEEKLLPFYGLYKPRILVSRAKKETM